MTTRNAPRSAASAKSPARHTARRVRGDDTKIRNVIDKTPAAIFIFQGNKNCLVNAAAEALTGYSRRELLGMDFWEIIHPEFRERVRRRGLARQRGAKPPARYELKIIRKDGSERWLDYSGALLKFRGKTAVIGTAIDITERKLAEANVQRKLNQLRALHQTSVAAMSTLELQAILDLVLEKIDGFLPCPAASTIRILNSETAVPEAKAFKNIDQREWELLIPVGGHGITKHVLESKQPVMIAEVLKDPRTRYPEFFRRNALVSYLGLPLIVGDKLLGDISFFTKKKHTFSAAEIELLSSLANHAALAIDRTQRYHQTRRRTDELATLNALTVAITKSLEVNSVLREAAKSMVQLFHFDGARIYLFNDVMNEAHLKSSFEIEPGPWVQVKAVQTTNSIIGTVTSSGKPVIFEDILVDSRYPQLSLTGGAKNAGARFMGVFPIQTKLKTWGALCCIAKTPRRLTREDGDLLIAVCNQIGIAIENASLFQKTADKARELSALYAVAGISAQFVDMNALVYQSMRKICDIFGFTAARIHILDEERQEIRIAAEEGFPRNPNRRKPYRIGEGLIGTVMQRGTPLTFQDMESDAQYHALAKSKDLLRAGFRSSFLIPLKVRGMTLGVMVFASTEARQFSDSDAQLINAIAFHLGIAIGNANLFARLRARTLELEKANKAKDEFLSVMSHELRTPLNVILGYTELIEQRTFGQLNHDLERSVVTVSRQANVLLNLIEGILVTTSIESGEIEARRRPIDLREFLDELRSSYDLPPDKGLRLEWDIPADPIAIHTDPTKLKHILRNLLDNAVKFTIQGSVSLSARYLPEVKSVALAVRDTGIGIARSDRVIIFEKFRQLDGSQTRSFGGVGLGLYIVKKFTSLLGGNIEVESEPGKGSIFTVTLPYDLKA